MADPDGPLLDRRMALGLVGAAATGGLAGTGLSAWWRRGGNGTSVGVLGSGKSVSVLITHHQRRVLFASGSSGVMFANALGLALPPLAPPLDVVLLDPGSNADVQARARALDAMTLLELPGTAHAPGYETIRRPALITFDDDVAVAIELVGDAWHAVLRKNGERVVIVPESPPVGQIPPLVVSINGMAQPTNAQAVFGPPLAGAGDRYYGVAPGDTRRLVISSDSVTFRP